MALSNELMERCSGTCELCGNNTAEQGYVVSPRNSDAVENQVAVCKECLSAMDEKDKSEHWRCLEGSIWNPESAVQALSYRLLYAYKEQDWANSVLSSVELDEAIVQWALSAYEVVAVHKDAYGNVLENGDNVVLTQALNVKGTSFSAAKGTVVKRIRLVTDNVEHIEGKINEEMIVILCKYVKKG